MNPDQMVREGSTSKIDFSSPDMFMDQSHRPITYGNLDSSMEAYEDQSRNKEKDFSKVMTEDNQGMVDYNELRQSDLARERSRSKSN